MRATIIGNTRDLSISCENGDKRFLGGIRIEGGGIVHEVFEDEGQVGTLPTHIDGFVSIYARQSEALRRALVVRNLDKPYQPVIDRYADIKNLTTFDREGAKLFISVMLNKIDFDYFADFIEANFVTELQYVIDVPFYALPETREAQSEVSAKLGYILPTKQEFRLGKPCFFPNAGISFGFEHRPSKGSGEPAGRSS